MANAIGYWPLWHPLEDRKTAVAKDFVVYRVHIHKVKQAELYELLESMPKSIRGLYIREALEHYRREIGLTRRKAERAENGCIPGGARSIRTLEESYEKSVSQMYRRFWIVLPLLQERDE